MTMFLVCSCYFIVPVNADCVTLQQDATQHVQFVHGFVLPVAADKVVATVTHAHTYMYLYVYSKILMTLYTCLNFDYFSELFYSCMTS